ncbi:MAG: prepilin-type N-terminal cleavage/methylation domain-containing protein [Candidatus Pacebacteria bacterium]|nr:prepilin-type N-terminal cleavage/methylation domain-containing protein [Candidatus Paceibacterota bacterium]
MRRNFTQKGFTTPRHSDTPRHSERSEESHQKNAFTIIELLVVVAVIAILAILILIPLQNARENARITKGLHFAEQIHRKIMLENESEYKFDDATPGTWLTEGETVTDFSNSGNDGTVAGQVYVQAEGVPGTENPAIYFDGN